jgi:hypothetical protein
VTKQILSPEEAEELKKKELEMMFLDEDEVFSSQRIEK